MSDKCPNCGFDPDGGSGRCPACGNFSEAAQVVELPAEDFAALAEVAQPESEPEKSAEEPAPEQADATPQDA